MTSREFEFNAIKLDWISVLKQEQKFYQTFSSPRSYNFGLVSHAADKTSGFGRQFECDVVNLWIHGLLDQFEGQRKARGSEVMKKEWQIFQHGLGSCAPFRPVVKWLLVKHSFRRRYA